MKSSRVTRKDAISRLEVRARDALFDVYAREAEDHEFTETHRLTNAACILFEGGMAAHDVSLIVEATALHALARIPNVHHVKKRGGRKRDPWWTAERIAILQMLRRENPHFNTKKIGEAWELQQHGRLPREMKPGALYQKIRRLDEELKIELERLQQLKAFADELEELPFLGPVTS